MKKPISLRAHLNQWVPDLAQNPDKLHVFIEKGRVSTKPGRSAAFAYHYTLQLVITDFAEPLDTLVVPIMLWAQEHQPDLIHSLDQQSKAIAIEAEIIDHDKIDVALTLELSERVLVRPVQGGGYECEHLDEPAMPDLTGPTDWQIYLTGPTAWSLEINGELPAVTP